MLVHGTLTRVTKLAAQLVIRKQTFERFGQFHGIFGWEQVPASGRGNQLGKGAMIGLEDRYSSCQRFEYVEPFWFSIRRGYGEHVQIL